VEEQLRGRLDGQQRRESSLIKWAVYGLRRYWRARYVSFSFA
jgi:hypothetical protein